MVAVLVNLKAVRNVTFGKSLGKELAAGENVRKLFSVMDFLRKLTTN